MSGVEDKLSELYRYIRQTRKAVVAFSGGVDSTLLLKVALDSLGREGILAVTLKSPLMPQRDIIFAEKMAGELGAPHRFIEADILQEGRVVENSPQRCYYCKRRIFELITDLARWEGYDCVLEGS
ncbi:MAG: TIGR00268 family protein, partial [Thermacetogeniaceae bacterium]